MPELGSLGSVRGALSNERPYRECVMEGGKGRGFQGSHMRNRRLSPPDNHALWFGNGRFSQR